jgi:hypothetical protein
VLGGVGLDKAAGGFAPRGGYGARFVLAQPQCLARPPDVQMRLLATGCENGLAALMVSNQKVSRTSYLFSLSYNA